MADARMLPAGTAAQLVVIGLFPAFVIPVYQRWRMGSEFEPGPWNLGSKYKWMAPPAIAEVIIMSGWSPPFNWRLINYSPIIVIGALLAQWIGRHDRCAGPGGQVTELVSTARGHFAVHAVGRPGGRPVVLVAGLGDDHGSWDPILEYLTPVYRCITFDNRGIGASPVTPGPYRIADLADDAHALHQALGLAPCVAIGSSMGGAIGQEWALRYPADVTGVVLSNTWGRTDTFLRVLFEHWSSLAGHALAHHGRADQLMDSLLLFSMSAAYLAAHPETVAEFRASAPPDLGGFQAAAAACLSHDALGRLGELTQPTLVLAGRHDILTRPELSAELADVLPHARLQLLEAGHMTFWETPETWGPAVTEWLEAQAFG